MTSLLELDHIATSAETLAEGVTAMEAALGVPLAPGGEHPHMGTHNRLLGLGPLYYEVIAINPDAPGPDRPRWFNIDNFAGQPRLTNWIVRTHDIQAALTALPQGFGTPVKLQRGDFSWSMAIPDSGILPWGGWAPAVIEWHGEAHPAPRLAENGLRLARLTLHHPDAEQMAETLGPLLPRDTVQFMEDATPHLVAVMDTPTGQVKLR